MILAKIPNTTSAYWEYKIKFQSRKRKKVQEGIPRECNGSTFVLWRSIFNDPHTDYSWPENFNGSSREIFHCVTVKSSELALFPPQQHEQF